MLKVLICLIFCFNAFGYSSCEINFVKLINGELPADLAKNPMINLWDEKFDPETIAKKLRGMEHQERKLFIKELAKLISKDKFYNTNIALLLTKIHQEKLVPFSFLNRNFVEHNFDNAKFFYSKIEGEFSTQLNVDPAKIEAVEQYLNSIELRASFKKEYEDILVRSNLTAKDIDFAINNGMTLRDNAKDLAQFRRYVDFLDNIKPHRMKEGLKHFEDIYVYNVARNLNPLMKPHKKFLEQTRKLQAFEERRIREIERGLKLQQETRVVSEIDEAIQKEANGIKVRIQEKLRFRKKIDDQALPQSLKQRARMQAKHEKAILRRIWNGCNKGSSQRIASAKKKFSRFKFALALGASPAAYLYTNWDKKDSDNFFWEKMGYEVAMGLFFTFVGNKIITNTSSSFWGKYFEGYWKFSILSGVDAYSYEALFGQQSMVRYLQRIYKGEVPESDLEKQYQELVNDPDFEKNMQELMAYLEEQNKKFNTKAFLDKYINLSASSSLDDEFRITQEDLKSEEAREMIMELIAERIYLENMGNVGFFQTGRKDLDRFTFYRAQSVLWDVKGLLVNLALFELMCREPLGQIGSWTAIIAIVVGNKYFDGRYGYQLRREAINQ